MRGLAIMAIVLHNYCHFIGRIVQENEYQFFAMNSSRLWQQLMQPDELLPVHLLSFFGHYGVPVFLFLSGFGLVRKYESGLSGMSGMSGMSGISRVSGSSGLSGISAFLRYNYLKLLRMLIVGFSLFLVVDAVTPGRFAFHWKKVIAQLLMCINVFPHPDKIIWPGIYWFFGLMMELYIVYRLLLYRRSSLWVIALIAGCWLLQAFCDPEGEVLNRLRYNAIGGILPFGLGILLARVSCRETSCFLLGNKQFPTGKQTVSSHPRLAWSLVFIVSCALTVAMSFHFQAWLWIPVIIIVGTVALVKAMPQWMLSATVWLGSLSAALFVAHPTARKLFITVAWKQDIYDGLLLYIIVAIAMAWAVKQIIDRIPAPRL